MSHAPPASFGLPWKCPQCTSDNKFDPIVCYCCRWNRQTLSLPPEAVASDFQVPPLSAAAPTPYEFKGSTLSGAVHDNVAVSRAVLLNDCARPTSFLRPALPVHPQQRLPRLSLRLLLHLLRIFRLFSLCLPPQLLLNLPITLLLVFLLLLLLFARLVSI